MSILEQLAKEKSEAGFIVDPQKFLLPDMGDYLEDELTLEYVKKLSEDIEGEDNGKNGAMFYIEPPFRTELGYHEDVGAFVVNAKHASSRGSMDYDKENAIDGDTLAFHLNNLNDGKKSFNIGGKQYSSVEDYIRKHTGTKGLDKDAQFELRFLGIDAPEIPHYGYVTYNKESEIIEKEFKDLKSLNTSQYVYDKNSKRDKNKKIKFIKTNKFKNKYLEVLDNNVEIGKEIRVVTSDDTKPNDKDYYDKGMKAKEDVLMMINKAEDIRIVLDAKTISKNSVYKKSGYDDDFLEEPIKNIVWHPIEAGNRLYDRYISNENKGSGYNAYGMDLYKRLLGVVYLKMPIEEGSSYSGEWINLSKYILATNDRVKALPDFTGDPLKESINGFASDAFKLWTYNINNDMLIDRMDINKDDLDDRIDIQEKIMKRSYDELLDWTVLIGDNLFMVPPTSIRVVNQNSNERMNLLRAKGSMTKSSSKTNRIIEMTLFFNEEDGINGIPFHNEFENGKIEDKKGNIKNIKNTYYMNGLRSLIAMFKFTPFLPIENKYINDVLNVDAVTLLNIQVSTTPDYPKCLSAVITLQDFDYRIYMPELPVPDPDKDEPLNKNMFAATINYKVMRYYYQKCIQRGEELKTVPFSSHQYLKATLGNKTALQPMKFERSNVDFYVADKTFLDKKLQAKLESKFRQNNQLDKIYPEQRDYIEDYLIPFVKTLDDKIYSDDFLNGFSKLEDVSEIKDYIQKEMAELNISNVKIKTKKEKLENETDVTQGDTYFKNIIDIELRVKNEGLTDEQVSSIFHNYAEELGEDVNYFKDGIIRIKLEGKEKRSEGVKNTAKFIGSFSPEMSNADYKLIKLITSMSKGDSQTSGEMVQDGQDELNKSNRIEDENSLTFVKLPIENIRIKTLASGFGNNFSNLDLQMSDGYAPQYVGGQDTFIEIQMETTDTNAVNMLNQLPKIAANYMRQYREVLTVYPLRIDSEITRLLGVNEVVVENVDISTVPQMPGLYNIAIKLVSVDRTLKNKEQLSKIEKPENYGPTISGNLTEIHMRDYFDLKESLAASEIYPDLELPTIDELERLGFKFIKYSNKSSYRRYPDPDFYFYYGHVLGNAILRDTILTFLKEETGKEQSFEMSDILGGAATIKPNSEGLGYDVIKTNELYNASLEGEKENNRIVKKLNEDINDLSLEDFEKRSAKSKETIVKALIDSDMLESWDVDKKIRCHFREKKFDSIFEDKEGSIYKEKIEKKANDIIKLIDEEFSKKVDALGISHKLNTNSNLENITKSFAKFVLEQNTPIRKIFELLAGDGGAKIIDVDLLGDFLFSMACSRTGDSEYTGIRKSTSWRPTISGTIKGSSFIPYAVVESLPQDLSKKTLATSLKDAIENGVVFGPFGIKLYGKNELEKEIQEVVNTNLTEVFLDPYYRSSNVTKKDLDSYKEGIITDGFYACHAALRESLYWLKKLLNENVLLSIYDVASEEAVKKIKEVTNEEINYYINNQEQLYDRGAASAEGFETEVDYDEKRNEQIVKILNEYLKDHKQALAVGKIFSMFVLSATSGNKAIYSYMLSRDYNNLNMYVKDVSKDKIGDEGYNKETYQFRKFIRALVGSKTIKGIEKIGHSESNAKEELENIAAKGLFLAAAENPMVYLSHSFYDMIINDKRGRMIRAFPTYYMIMIDEGREIGYWKLHDNFYNMNAISEFQIVKSRKIAADTATITMSNMFKTFDKEDDNLKVDEVYSLKDAFSSIYSPQAYARKEQLNRLKDSPISSVVLKPGIRIHLRMGYGANASTLPILFNGCITEVGAGEYVEIIAQGDGVELTNPIFSTNDAEDIESQDSFKIIEMLGSWLKKGATPKEILTAILTTDGGWFRKKVQKFTKGRLYNENPYGIEHFGDKKFVDIFEQGECVQNIYEATEKPSWGKKVRSDLIEDYGLDTAPKLSTQVFGKSYWDIMHICASSSPDYIASIVPFQYRSSIFFGQPRYYYAYDYDKSPEGAIREKRKPFQQYHIYTSYSDIIRNNITASDKDVKTCGVGLYERKKSFGRQEQSKVGPLYVDYSIYTEKQKTMVIDTQLLSKGTVMGDILPFMNVIQDELADGKGIFQGGKEIAWRMTASALRDSIKEMYKGEVIVIGDPSVKPYDKIWIEDVYERMNGCMEVEAVVHSFSVEEGFVTSIYPDCIATIDDRYERIAQQLVGSTIAKGVGAYIGVVSTSWAFAKNTKPLLTTLSGYASSAGFAVEKNVNDVLKLIGKNDINADKYINKIEGIREYVGISKGGVAYESFNRSLLKWPKKIDFDSVDDVKDIINNMKRMNKEISTLDTKNILQSITDSGKADNATLKALTKELDELNVTINSGISKAGSAIGNTELTQLKNTIRGVMDVSDNADEVAKVKEIYEAINKIDKISSPQDLATFTRALDYLDEGSDLAKTLTKTSKGIYSAIAESDDIYNGVRKLSKSSNFSKAGKFLNVAKGSAGAIAITMALEFAITMIITSFINEYIERWMRNLQVLQVFPVKKNGMVFTAGLDGSKGLVVGSPTEHDEDIITKWVGNFFGTDDGMFDSFKGFFVNMFATDKMREMGNRYRRKNNLEALNENTGREMLVQNLLRYKSADEMKKQNAYKSQLLLPRFTQLVNEDGEFTEQGRYYFNKNSVLSLEDIGKNKKITEDMIYIRDYKPLEKFFSNKYLSLDHEVTSSPVVPQPTFILSGKAVSISCIKCEDNIINAPFLREDSIVLLTEIMNRIKKKVYPNKPKYGEKDEFENNPIRIKSALRIGETSVASTGLHFRINSSPNNKIKEILDEILEEYNKVSNSYKDTDSVFFEYTEKGEDINISISPIKEMNDY